MKDTRSSRLGWAHSLVVWWHRIIAQRVEISQVAVHLGSKSKLECMTRIKYFPNLIGWQFQFLFGHLVAVLISIGGLSALKILQEIQVIFQRSSKAKWSTTIIPFWIPVYENWRLGLPLLVVCLVSWDKSAKIKVTAFMSLGYSIILSIIITLERRCHSETKCTIAILWVTNQVLQHLDE